MAFDCRTYSRFIAARKFGEIACWLIGNLAAFTVDRGYNQSAALLIPTEVFYAGDLPPYPASRIASLLDRGLGHAGISADGALEQAARLIPAEGFFGCAAQRSHLANPCVSSIDRARAPADDHQT